MQKKIFPLIKLLGGIVVIGVLCTLVFTTFTKTTSARKKTDVDDRLLSIRSEQELRCMLGKHYTDQSVELSSWPKDSKEYVYTLQPQGVTATAKNGRYQLQIQSYTNETICCHDIKSGSCKKLHKRYPACSTAALPTSACTSPQTVPQESAPAQPQAALSVTACNEDEKPAATQSCTPEGYNMACGRQTREVTCAASPAYQWQAPSWSEVPCQPTAICTGTSSCGDVADKIWDESGVDVSEGCLSQQKIPSWEKVLLTDVTPQTWATACCEECPAGTTLANGLCCPSGQTAVYNKGKWECGVCSIYGPNYVMLENGLCEQKFKIQQTDTFTVFANNTGLVYSSYQSQGDECNFTVSGQEARPCWDKGLPRDVKEQKQQELCDACDANQAACPMLCYDPDSLDAQVERFKVPAKFGGSNQGCSAQVTAIDGVKPGYAVAGYVGDMNEKICSQGNTSLYIRNIISKKCNTCSGLSEDRKGDIGYSSGSEEQLRRDMGYSSPSRNRRGNGGRSSVENTRTMIRDFCVYPLGENVVGYACKAEEYPRPQ